MKFVHVHCTVECDFALWDNAFVILSYEDYQQRVPLWSDFTAEVLWLVDMDNTDGVTVKVVDRENNEITTTRILLRLTPLYGVPPHHIMGEAQRLAAVRHERDDVLRELEVQRNRTKAQLVTLQQAIDRDCRDTAFVDTHGYRGVHSSAWKLALAARKEKDAEQKLSAV